MPASTPPRGGGDSSSPAPAASPPPSRRPPAYSPATRQLRQMGLVLAGAAFMAASVAVTRRSVLRRRLEAVPAFHTSNRHAPAFDGSDRVGLAAQALGLATLNVMSFGVLLTGGIAYGFDLCSVDELRRRTRAALQRPGNLDPEAEREMEDMMRSLLNRLGMDATPPERPPLPREAGNAPPSK